MALSTISSMTESFVSNTSILHEDGPVVLETIKEVDKPTHSNFVGDPKIADAKSETPAGKDDGDVKEEKGNRGADDSEESENDGILEVHD